MAATVDTHLFGSRRGYECLAKSSAVTAAEDRVLSEFGFGQNSDERFLQGLATRPTAFARPLPGGRIAITRVLNGPLDDGGRPTLERRTILVTPREYLALRHDLPKLIADTRLWSAGAFGTGGTLPLPSGGGRAAPASDVSWRIFDAWVSALERPPHGVVVGSDDISAQAVLLVASQLADADALRFSWGIRLLSPIAWVDVATLSPFGAMDGRRPVFGISQGDCVNEAVRRAQTSSPTRLPSVDSLRARDLQPVEVRTSGKAGARRPVSGELDLRARAALRQRKLLLGIAALIVAACSLSVALYFAFSRPTTGGLGEQGFVSSGGGGAPFLPTQNESTRPGTPPPSTAVSGSEAEKSTSPDPAETGASRIALVPPKGTAEPAPVPSPATVPPPASDPRSATDSSPPPPPPPPPTDSRIAEAEQPVDLSHEDKRKVREMIEWSKKVRRVEAVFKESVLPLIVEVKSSSIEYDQYVRSYGLWLKQSSGPNRASAPPEPRKPRIIEEYPYWESTLVKAVNQVQGLQLTEPPDVTALKASDRFIAQAMTGSDNDRMHVVAQIMQWFLFVSTVADLQGQVGSIQELKSEKAWDGELKKYRNSALFNKLNDREKEVRAQLEDVQKFVSLRSALLTRVCNLKADESAFFKGKPSVQSYFDLYLKVMTPVLPEVPLGEEFGLLQEEVSAAMKALPPAP